ncbi:MAG: ATP-binding cassette domain-containing protein [Candidatus Omnitrophica bacterium]|nr:ATP-binding cassette domain-containing protein [Candidatus Omnitrophota bacterium]
MSENVIEFKNIAKKYCFSLGKQALINSFLGFFKKNRKGSEVWALKNINFSVERGQILGIIGENASGKTTILRIISRITVPSLGQVVIKGKVAGLLDLGAGFHPELTGRENVYLDAALYGLDKKQTDVLFTEIVEFSGLNDFIDAQVKTYSQGMLVRLGFSVAVHINPDIFLIDDSLAVGDEEFQRKCLARIIQMNKQGKTIVIVSHDLDSLSRIASRGILLKDGQMIKDDSIHKSIVRYVQAVGEKNSIACIDRGKLSIIFNSGRIALLWDGKPITCDFGGYLSVKVLDKWLMSWQAHWQVIERENDFFKVQGQWPNSPISAEIEIKLDSDRGFACSAKINLGVQVIVDKAVFGFMFNDKYTQYLNADKIEQIAGMENSADEQWQDLYRTDQSNALLVLSASDEIPAVWAEFYLDQQKGFGLIQVKNESFEASVIQAQVLLQHQSTVTCKTVIQLLDKAALEQKIIVQQEQRTINSNNLSLKLEQKGFKFFDDQRAIIKASGLKFGFQHKNHFYNIFDGKWDIEKCALSEFMINSDFIALGLSAELNLSLKDNELIIKLELKNKQSKQQPQPLIHIDAEFVDDYASYFSLNQENDFLTATEFDEKIILKEAKCGFVGLNLRSKSFESIIFSCEDNTQISLYNCRQEIGARRVQLTNKDMNFIKATISRISHKSQKQDFLLNQSEKFKIQDQFADDALSIDSSQDRLQVFLGAREITALDGFTSGIFLNKRWYESHALAKIIEKKENVLFVTIQRKFPNITEYWQFELKQQSLIWKVYLESSEELEDFEYKAGIMLSPEFEQWINAYEKNRFNKDVKEMKIIELKEVNSCLLGAAADDLGCSVLFEQDNLPEQTYVPLLQHSNRTRVLQFCSKLQPRIWGKNRKLVFSSSLKAVSKVAWQKLIDEYCNQAFSIIPTNDSQLTAIQQKIEFYFKGKPISAECGLAVSISADDEFDSFRGDWEIKKQDENILNIRITYNSAQFAQNWYLQVKNGYIYWKVELEVFEQIVISSLVINLFLPSNFVNWLSDQSQGFIDFKNQSDDLKSISLIDNRTRYMILRQNNAADVQPVSIAFAPLVDMRQWLFQMYRPANKDIVALGIKRLFADAKLVLDLGRHELFKANLEIFSGDTFNQNIINQEIVSINTISKNKLKVIFEKAKIKLFFADKQLSNGLGLYTGIKLDDQWADSSQEMWQIDSESTMIEAKLCIGKVQQIHKLKLISDKQLNWNICFELGQENVEQIIVGIMLSKEFIAWHTSGGDSQSGEFSDKNKDDSWQQIIVSEKPIALSSMSKQMPKITWESECSIDCDNIIEDTDKNHNSRVLVSKTKKISAKDKRIEFNISIKIDE